MTTKIASVQFINKENCYLLGPNGKKFVGHNTIAFFTLTNCTDNELLDIINYKSWIHRQWGKPTQREYFVHKWSEGINSKTIWCLAGFSSILVRYLQNRLSYTIHGKEAFQAKQITLPNMKYTLWNFQKDAVNAWFESGAYGIIKSPTGSGKGTIGIAIIKRANVRTLICVHTSDLLTAVWFNYLVEQFGENIKSRIGIVGGGLSKKDRMLMHVCNGNFSENINKDIVIATGQSLLNKLDILGKQNFGLIIADECHRYPAEHFKKITNAVRSPMRCGLTATVNRPDGLTPMFRGLLGEVVYKISIKELVAKGLLVEPIFHTAIISDVESENKILTCNLKLLEYVRFVKNVSASSKKKFKYITQLCINLKLKQNKFMLYTDFINKGEKDENENIKIRDEYVNTLRKNGIRVVGITSDMSSLQRQDMFSKLSKGELDGLVFGALGNEGINIPIVDSVIMCNATASTIRFTQRCGRAMRRYGNKKDCHIYEILLNTKKELEWSERNFTEYEVENFEKEIIYIN